MKKLLSILEPWIVYCSEMFWDFLLNIVLQKRGKFLLLPSALNTEQSATMNGESTDSGDRFWRS